MVRAGKIVAQRLGYILAKEDAAGVLHRVQHGKRVVHADLQMLGGNDIHGFDGLAHVIGHDDLAVGVHARAGDGGAGQLRDLYLQLGLHGLGQIPAVGDKHGAGQLIVLGLAQKVGGHPRGVAAAIRQNKNFGRSCDHINADLAENLALGGGNIDVAGADDLVHGGYTFGAVGKGCHGLCAARLENQINARNDRCCQNGGVYLAVPPGGGRHDDLPDARDLGRDDIHQNGRGVGSRAARHIDAGALDGGVLLPQHDAGGVVDNEIFVQLLLMEAANIPGGHLQGRDKLRVGLFQLGKRLIDLGLADPHIGQFGVVKFGGVFDQGGIAAGAHIGDDGVNGGLHIGFGADVAVEDLLGAYLIKIIQTDHLARASFILFSSSVSWAYLNL